MPETFLARFPVSVNTENSRRTREKPLVPRVQQAPSTSSNHQSVFRVTLLHKVLNLASIILAGLNFFGGYIPQGPITYVLTRRRKIKLLHTLNAVGAETLEGVFSSGKNPNTSSTWETNTECQNNNDNNDHQVGEASRDKLS